MAWRKKLTAQKLVDFLLASLDDSNPSKRSLVDLAGGEPSPAPPPPKPATPKRRSSRGKKQTEGGDVEMADAAEGGEASATKDDTAGDTAGDGANAVPPTPPTPAQRELPETEAYSHLLVLLLLLDANDPECKAASVAALNRLSQFNRRTLDALQARIVFYYSLAHERFGELAEVRPSLLALHRVAALRFDEMGQETILNLLMRNYLHYNMYDQAEKLRSKAQLPASRSNQQQCRYLYYLGRIRAIQLEYSDAKECLTQAHRKAPKLAKGFALELTKWITVVRLLLGEIPEKKDLTTAVSGGAAAQRALLPYLELTAAVRLGDLEKFRAVQEAHEAAFRADKTTNLVTRLRRNVIRTGLRRVSLAYSAISLDDVAQKLGLGEGDGDVEFVVAKAIRDGGIDATIDHDARTMHSSDATDVYSTGEPQAAFHARIAFCLDTHNEAVKAMRYPDKVKKGKGDGERKSAKDRDLEELAMHIMDEDEMDEF